MSLFPSVSSPQRLGASSGSSKSNAKVPLRAGFSLMDWVRLSKSGKDLRGIGTSRMLKVTPEELQKHNKRDDAWMAIRGFVYNVTAYMDYHPGGEKELMRGAGKDATQLFEEVHRWVNFESMLGACLVGRLEQGPQILSKFSNPSPKTSALLAPQPGNAYKGLALPKAPVFNESANDANGVPGIVISAVQDVGGVPFKATPTTSWHQSVECVTLVCYTKVKNLDNHTGVVCDVEDGGQRIRAEILTKETCISVDVALSRKVKQRISVVISTEVGKVEFLMHKAIPGDQWSDIGKYGESHCKSAPRKNAPLRYRPCRLAKKITVTHDTSIYHFDLPEGSYMFVPIGYHVYFEAEMEGIYFTRPYTVICDISDEKAPLYVRKFSVMIKTYQDGAITSLIDHLGVGQEISVSNCEGSFDLSVLDRAQRVVLLAAGTGFTPMVRIIRYCLLRKEQPAVHLEFFNKTRDDILWRGKLEALAEKHEGRFTVEHVLSQPDSDWSGKTGRINMSLVKELVASSTDPKGGIFVCVCGSKPFTQLTMKFLQDLGLNSDQTHAFLA